MLYRLFRSEHYEKKLLKIDNAEQQRIFKFEQSLKEQPYSGKPLGYKFFREKKFNGKRILFLVYEEHRSIFLITITTKKTQQHEIDLVKANLDIYQEELETILKGL